MQQSLKAHASDSLGQQGTSAWIIYPEADEIDNGPDQDPTPVDYTALNTKLQALVQQLTGITAAMTTYTPDDADANKALGRALYQYDPQAQAPEPQQAR